MTKMRRMARQHESMRRVYAAAKEEGIISGPNPLTELARLLVPEDEYEDQVGVVRRVKNWDNRGPSADGLLLIQERTGINATWIQTGKGPKMVAGWPPGRVDKGGKPADVPGTSFQPSIVLGQVAKILQAVPDASRLVVADLLKALALAPDSKAVIDSIILHADPTKAQVESVADMMAKLNAGGANERVLVAEAKGAGKWDESQLRQNMLRLAEAHPDKKARVLLTDFTGKLDRLMRDNPAASPPSRSKPVKG